MNDDTPPADRSSEADDPVEGELVPVVSGDASPATTGDGTADAVVAGLLRQHQRESVANRAQARELMRALGSLQESQEYLGKALRQEQARSRRRLWALPVAAALGAGVVLLLWSRVDEGRREVEARVAAVEALDRDAGERTLREAYDTRMAALRESLERAEGELDHAREGGRAELESARARESELLRRIEDLELRDDERRRSLGELAGLRARVEAYRERVGAESARADALLEDLRALEREAGRDEGGGRVPTVARGDLEPPARGPAPTAVRVDPPRPVEPPRPRVPVSTEVSPGRPDLEAGPVVPTEARGPVASDAATVERLQSSLNGLLALSPDMVRYRLTRLGGARGHELVDVQVVGEDESGRVVRRLEAERAEVQVDEAAGTVRLAFHDGALLVAGRRAPFYDGRYSVVTTTDVGRWRDSGLTCVRFE